MFAENCYLVIDEQAGECAIVDPGEEAGLILHKVEESGAKLVAIWLTHAHLDHVLGVSRIAAEAGVPVWLHPADRALYDAVPDQAGGFGLGRPDLRGPARTWALPRKRLSHRTGRRANRRCIVCGLYWPHRPARW